jgi:protein-glutamine gamma-glutamyltransferase
VTAAAISTPRPRAVAPIAVRIAAVAALALFAGLQWLTLLSPSPAGPIVLAVLVGAGAAALVAVTRRRAVTAVVAVALVPIGLLVAGATVKQVLPGGWGGLAGQIGDGVSALPDVRIPYSGAQDVVELVITAGGVALILFALVAAAAFAKRGRAVALVPLVLLYAFPATQTSADSPYLRGAVFAVLIGGVLWGERFATRGAAVQAPIAAAILALGAVAGIALGPGLDAAKPWVNWDKLVNSLSKTDEQFAWDHTYGPMNWPRDGRVVMRISAKNSAYWKAANLDGFDGTRWVRAGLRPDNGFPRRTGADVRIHPRWVQSIRVTLNSMRTDQVIGAGSTLQLNHIRLDPLPVGSPGTWAVVGQLHAGDSYDAQVYTPDPGPAELVRAGTAYPDVMELYRSIKLPSHTDNPAGGTEMVFAPFGSHRQPIALGPSATIAESGNKVLDRSEYGRTYRLAQRLAAGATTPYEFARRIQAYLNSDRYIYSEDVPRSKVPLDAFLFRDHRGYCQQFSGAMALLLRMGGVPARVAAGFSPGSLDSQRDQYVVRDIDAHSWVEAYFPHYGWITFDPTPAVAPARSQAAFDPNTGTQSNPTADGGLGDKVADPKGGGKTISSPEHDTFPVLPVLAGVVALVVVVMLVVLLVRRLRRRTPAPEDPRLAELERALRRSGRPVEPGMTLRALEKRFAGEPEAQAYVRSVREARYGFGAPPPTREQRRALRRALAAGWEWSGRLRALWALPPSVWHRS